MLPAIAAFTFCFSVLVLPKGSARQSLYKAVHARVLPLPVVRVSAVRNSMRSRAALRQAALGSESASVSTMPLIATLLRLLDLWPPALARSHPQLFA